MPTQEENEIKRINDRYDEFVREEKTLAAEKKAQITSEHMHYAARVLNLPTNDDMSTIRDRLHAMLGWYDTPSFLAETGRNYNDFERRRRAEIAEKILQDENKKYIEVNRNEAKTLEALEELRYREKKSYLERFQRERERSQEAAKARKEKEDQDRQHDRTKGRDDDRSR